MQAANSKQGAPPPQCLDANITWCGDYHRQGIPDGHLCKWDPMGALFTLLNILDSADKLAHQNRVRETTVFYSVWVIGGMGQLCVSYVFPTIYIHHETCVHPKARGPLKYPLKGSNILFIENSRETILPLALETLLRFCAEPSAHSRFQNVTSSLIAWINGWRCLSHASNWRGICSIVAMIGSILHTSPESPTADWQPLYTARGQAGDLSCNMWQRHQN